MSAALNPNNKKESLEANFQEQNPGSSFEQKDSQSDIPAGTAEVSDFMEGLDVPTPSEKVSERTREDDKKSKAAGGGKGDSGDASGSYTPIAPLKIPSQRIMVRRIRQELHRQIKDLMKQAQKEEKKGAFYLNEILYKIRNLKGSISGLATATFEFVKNLYISLFEGKVK